MTRQPDPANLPPEIEVLRKAWMEWREHISTHCPRALRVASTMHVAMPLILANFAEPAVSREPNAPPSDREIEGQWITLGLHGTEASRAVAIVRYFLARQQPAEPMSEEDAKLVARECYWRVRECLPMASERDSNPVILGKFDDGAAIKAILRALLEGPAILAELRRETSPDPGPFSLPRAAARQRIIGGNDGQLGEVFDGAWDAALAAVQARESQREALAKAAPGKAEPDPFAEAREAAHERIHLDLSNFVLTSKQAVTAAFNAGVAAAQAAEPRP